MQDGVSTLKPNGTLSVALVDAHLDVNGIGPFHHAVIDEDKVC